MDRPTITQTAALTALLTEDLRSKVGFAGTPAILRESLIRTSEVAQLQNAIRSGGVSEEEIEEFVTRLLRNWQPDVRFENDFALAAIAIVFESHHSPFAQQYLKDLADLRLREFSMASGVAKESSRHRPSACVEMRIISGLALDGGKLPTQIESPAASAEKTRNTITGADVKVDVRFDQHFAECENAAA